MSAVLLRGLAIWLAASMALRLAGQWVFADARQLALLFAVSIPVMIWLPRRIVAASAAARSRPAAAAIVLVVPGMLLDTACTLAFQRLFPNIQPQRAAVFAAWILLCNAIALGSLYAYHASGTDASNR